MGFENLILFTHMSEYVPKLGQHNGRGIFFSFLVLLNGYMLAHLFRTRLLGQRFRVRIWHLPQLS